MFYENQRADYLGENIASGIVLVRYLWSSWQVNSEISGCGEKTLS